jgi:integrase
MSDSKNKIESIPVGDRVSMFLRGKVWYANYQANGKQHRLSLKTRIKREALLRAQRIEAELTRGEAPQPAKFATIGEAIDAFLNWHETDGRSPATMKVYRRVMVIVRRLAGSQRKMLASHLDFPFADALKAEAKAKGNSPKTIRTKLVVLRSLVRFAFRRKLIPADPLDGYKIKKAKARPQPCWSWEDSQRILNAAPARWRPLLTFLRETGCRAGEAIHLTWDDVHLNREEPSAHIRAKDGWKPKTGDERRVPLTQRAAATLASLPRRGRWVFEYSDSRRPGTGSSNMHDAALRCLKQVLKGLKLPGKLHTFRHTFISHALLSAPEPVVRSWVGHVDAETIRMYTHVGDAVSRGYIGKL